MKLSEKLKFLADRAEDGQEFYWGEEIMKFGSIGALLNNHNGAWNYSDIRLNTIDHLDIKIKPQWIFTEDEKIILRNLPEQYKWIARDDDDGTMGELFIYAFKPSKFNGTWIFNKGSVTDLNNFKHLFQSIQWSDDEPCEFRKYL